MLGEAIRQIKTAFILLVILTILMGCIYPAFITGIARFLFPWQANGSLIRANNKIIGSRLIGQPFTDPKYFCGRPSATLPFPYNAENSAGSNKGPSNPAFLATIKQRIAELQKLNPQIQELIPVDLVTASASGLDPDISPFAAFYQIPRIAKARGISETKLRKLVENSIEHREFWILGEPRVNVLQLNLALDHLKINRELP